MQAPLRLHLCQKLTSGQAYTLQNIFDLLKTDYVGESHFTLENLTRHIQALKAIGILAENYNDNDVNYSITAYGLKKVQKTS